MSILTKLYKASLDVPCRATCGRVHVDAWACGCAAPESIEPRKRTLHARTCAHARPHALVHTYARVTEASASKIGHLPKPAIIDREATSCMCAIATAISISMPRISPKISIRSSIRVTCALTRYLADYEDDYLVITFPEIRSLISARGNCVKIRDNGCLRS